jgi:H+/Cl- antiporter ClcA
MLPLEKPWYRTLLFLTLLIGAAGGVLALAFNKVTGAGIDFFFGNAGTGWWEGHWWWIPLTATGGLIVAALRRIWKVPDQVPSPIKLAFTAWVEPGTVIPWVLISVVSLIAGAAMGPFFAFAVMGGGLGSWLVTRLKKDEEEEARQQYTLTGMAGTMGAAFTSPLFAAILTGELSPTQKRSYVAAFIPALFAATLGYVIYFGVTGTTMLGNYALPAYEFTYGHLLIGALLGVLAAFILILFALIRKLTFAVFSKIPNSLVSGVFGGALVGLIAFALPLVANSGSSQLVTVLQNSAVYGAAFLFAILIGKMLILALSQAAGFLGGFVFPLIFIGGTAGVLVNTLFPQIPIALAVGSLLAAVAGAILNAPVSLILIAAGTVAIAPVALVPVCIAVVTSHMTLAIVRYYVVGEEKLKVQQPD